MLRVVCQYGSAVCKWKEVLRVVCQYGSAVCNWKDVLRVVCQYGSAVCKWKNVLRVCQYGSAFQRMNSDWNTSIHKLMIRQMR